MAKSANLYARIEPDLKEQAETILSALGIPASNAITMFYRQVVLQKGLPFDVKLPSAQPVDLSSISEEQLNVELEKGYADTGFTMKEINAAQKNGGLPYLVRKKFGKTGSSNAPVMSPLMNSSVMNPDFNGFDPTDPMWLHGVNNAMPRIPL